MPVISYGQNQEDVYLARLFPQDHKGFYIDVGAGDPVLYSVTKLFYDRGWRGINIEPQEALHAALCRERERDINLRIGLSSREGKMTLFQPTANELATVSSDAAENARRLGFQVGEEEIAVSTLAKVCEEHNVGDIDILKVDVEGHERAVLEGADWNRWRPRVLIIEATMPTTADRCEHLWEDLVISAGYHCALFDGMNNYYLREEDRHLDRVLAVPLNWFDDYIPYRYYKQIIDLEARAKLAETRLLGLQQSPFLGRLLKLYKRLGKIDF